MEASELRAEIEAAIERLNKIGEHLNNIDEQIDDLQARAIAAIREDRHVGLRVQCLSMALDGNKGIPAVDILKIAEAFRDWVTKVEAAGPKP